MSVKRARNIYFKETLNQDRLKMSFVQLEPKNLVKKKLRF